MTRDALLQRLRQIPSETSLADRVALHDLAASHFTGQGFIYDIGTAAGGSTFCLGSGLRDNPLDESKKKGKILGFDLFAGYSIHAFRNSKIVQSMIETRGTPFASDLEMFNTINADYLEYITPVKLNIVTGFAEYAKPAGLEIAHIDAAKSIELWNVILNVISKSAIPGHTVLIFQDFERCRLPWQWMFISEMLQAGAATWLGQYDGGTIHIKLSGHVPDAIQTRANGFSYTPGQALKNFEFLRHEIASNPKRAEVFRGKFDAIATCTLAYIYKQLGDVTATRATFNDVPEDFLAKEQIYKREMGEFLA